MSLINFSQKYLDSKALSNSGLSYFLKSPKKFKAYQDKEYEETSSGYAFGDLLHTLVLEPQNYGKKFIDEPDDLAKPSHATHQSFVNAILSGMSPEEAHDCSFKSKGPAREKKIAELNELYKDFLSFCNKVGDRETVIPAEKERLIAAENSLRLHPACNYLLWGVPQEGLAFNEKEVIGYEYNGLLWKSKIDRLIVDLSRRVITVIEFKTTGFDVSTFRRAYVNYSYYRQQALYIIAAHNFLESNNIVDNLSGFNIQCKCVVVESNYPHEARAFHITPLVIEQGKKEIDDAVELYKWHIENEIWHMTKEAYQNSENCEVISEEIFD